MPRAPLVRLSLLSLAASLAGSAAGAQVVRYYHLDAIGNVRAVTDQAGTIVERHDYLPFGEECTTGPCASNPGVGVGQPRKFTSKERDAETGLDYFGARYYGSKIGRFTTVDPKVNLKASILNPQRWNRYAYGLNNPLRFNDPDGREVPVVVDNRMYNMGLEGGPAMGRQEATVAGLVYGGALAAAFGAAVAPLVPAAATEAMIAGGTCTASGACRGLVQGLAESTSGAPPGMLAPQLPMFSASTISTALSSAAETGKSAVPRGLRALASHVDRGDSAFAGVEKTVESAQGLIQGILQNPARVTAGRVTVDAYNAAGQGVRLEGATGRFVGFLEGSQATR